MSARHLIRAVLAAALGFAAAGCATIHSSGVYNDVRTGHGERPIATLEVTNTGWYLFDFIPIACGDPENPNEVTCLPFQDTVTLQNNLNILTREMIRRKCRRFENLSSRWTNEKFLFLLITRHGYHTSAVLLADEKETK